MVIYDAFLLELFPNLNQHKCLMLVHFNRLFFLILRHSTFSCNQQPTIWLVRPATESHRILPTLGQYMVPWSKKSRLQPQCDPSLRETHWAGVARGAAVKAALTRCIFLARIAGWRVRFGRPTMRVSQNQQSSPSWQR